MWDGLSEVILLHQRLWLFIIIFNLLMDVAKWTYKNVVLVNSQMNCDGNAHFPIPLSKSTISKVQFCLIWWEVTSKKSLFSCSLIDLFNVNFAFLSLLAHCLWKQRWEGNYLPLPAQCFQKLIWKVFSLPLEGKYCKFWEMLL